MKRFSYRNCNAVALSCAAALAISVAARADDREVLRLLETTQAPGDDSALSAPAAPSDHEKIIIQTVEHGGAKKQAREVAWLGLAVEESSEALSSQLALKRGEGLTVDFLAAGSPAAKADFRKNDVLVELDGQMLVHPIQLRKLVQMHEDGDMVKLTFFRGGKKETVSVKLGKTDWFEAGNKEDPAMGIESEDLQSQLTGLGGRLRVMSDSLSRAQLDKTETDVDIKHTMDLTRKAIQDAVQRVSTDQKHVYFHDQDLGGVAHDGVDVDKDATIIVRDKRNSSRTMLQTDDTGTYIVEAGAKIHLTARDKAGKALFDGEIDTPVERQKVPREVWEKVESMYKQVAAPDDGKPKKPEIKPDE